MVKKIAWFSELPLEGFVERDFQNMRTEFAWFVAQQSAHHNIQRLTILPDNIYDIGIIIIPKTLSPYKKINIVGQLKRVCARYGFMQEGPSWYFQDLPLEESLYFYDIMLQANFALAHNDIDRSYYEGLLDKDVYINPTLMIEDSIKDLPKNIEERNGIMLGGNLVRWYGGFNSFMTAMEIGEDIAVPQMGRMQPSELRLNGLKHLPYMHWLGWMRELNKFKYAVNLNPNTIAGTFSLNCAFLKIPCIGNINCNTQRHCFPELSVEPHDLSKAKKLLKRLKEEPDFYYRCAEVAKDNYQINYSEGVYKNHWEKIIGYI